ncbi:MAG: hypothetical protein ACR2GB_06455 [Nocardioidaceae bacterium]
MVLELALIDVHAGEAKAFTAAYRQVRTGSPVIEHFEDVEAAL